MVTNKKTPFLKKKLLDGEIGKSFLEIIFYGLFWGSFINYSLSGIFGVPFKIFTFPAYGLFLYLIKSQFVPIWRNLWFKYENIGGEYI